MLRLLFLFFLFNSNIFLYSIQEEPLERLLNDMKLYKLDSQGNRYFHAGDLYEHSIWTYNAMVEVLNSDLPYVQGLNLTERQKEILALAALLHDIGKAGRKNLFDGTHPRLHYEIIKDEEGTIKSITYYPDRQEHPHICFDYAVKPFCIYTGSYENKHELGEYYMIDPETAQLSPFDITELYEQFNLTSEEQKVFAILLGIHYEFGNVIGNKITVEQFLKLLDNFVKITDYNQGVLDEELVRLALLIQIADLKGVLPVPAQATHLFPEGISCTATHQSQFDDVFTFFGYITINNESHEPPAVIKMNEILDCFDARQQKNQEYETFYKKEKNEFSAHILVLDKTPQQIIPCPML